MATTEWRSELTALRERAGARSVEPSDWLATTQRARRTTIAALAVDAVTASLDELVDAGNDDVSADVLAALERVAPGLDLEVALEYPDAALAGLVNLVKGALFELEVMASIESGAIDLPEGVASAALVDDFGTAGHDVELFDEKGHLVDVVQLKASSVSDAIARHLGRYPDIEVWATSEASEHAVARGIEAADTGISDADLAAQVTSAFAESGLALGDVLDEVVPQIGLTLAAARAGLELVRGRDRDEVWGELQRRAGALTLLSSVAWVASAATGADAVRIPSVLVASGGRDVYQELRGSSQRIEGLGAVAASLGGGQRPATRTFLA